ncbi:MAG TPA: hypothetical protein VLA33_12390 [Gemmatimonadota bacterium]|nr:hypothetical protein [Gemmatimonadota bacterium]
MRRILLALAAAFIAAGPPTGVAEAARVQLDCRDWCAKKAAEKCKDVSSTWCNAYIAGCLGGCGISHL